MDVSIIYWTLIVVYDFKGRIIMNGYLKNKIDRARDICRPLVSGIGRSMVDVKGNYARMSAKFRKRYIDLKSGRQSALEALNRYFNERIDKFRDSFDSDRLFKKIGDVGKVAGSNVVYMVLVLYYSLLGKDVPLKDRAMVLASLGYFISPIDFIPDLLGVVGFTDDFAVLMLVFRKIRDNITPEVHLKAKERLSEWFGEESVERVKI